MPGWPSLQYERWSACRDTLHALTQILGKCAVALAPPEPQLQHAALRLSARGWETNPLPAPDGFGALVVALDLERHQAVVESTHGESRTTELVGRSVAEVTGRVLAAIRELAGDIEVNLTPQETPWSVALDEDFEHHHYDAEQAARYFTAATQAALVLGAFRAPFRGRITPVNAWWGSFDLAVNVFSGQPADPPSQDFIMRNAMDVQEFAIGWWPGDARYERAAFYAYAHPAPAGFSEATLSPEDARWEPDLGEFVLDWDDLIAAEDRHAAALEFAHSAFRHACTICQWDPTLAATMDGDPPPIR